MISGITMTSEKLKAKLNTVTDEIASVIFVGQIEMPSDRSEQLSDEYQNVSITLEKDFVTMQDLKSLEVFFYGCHAVISQEPGGDALEGQRQHDNMCVLFITPPWELVNSRFES